jgi:hypothetical protein
MAAFDSVRFSGGRPLLGEVSADKLNAILAEIRKNRPRGERGITVRQAGDATYIGLAAAFKGGGAAERHPFQISASIDAEQNVTLTVDPGTLNSLLPSNIFNGPGLREFSGGSGLQYVVLTGTSDGQQFTSCALSVESEAVAPQTPTVFGLPTTAAFLLGVVYEGSVFQVQKTNLLVTGKQQYVKEKSSPAAPGTLPYEIYYVWG